MTDAESARFLRELEETIRSRREAGAEESYVASLLKGDEDHMLKKLIEEAGELALACKDGRDVRIAAEAADLLFHMLTALARYGLGLEDVVRELQARTGTSGHDEKRSRGH